MKKFLATVLVLLSATQAVSALPADTKDWVCNPNHVSVSAGEIDLKSDLKNDFRIYQTTLTNLTNQSVDVSIPTNASADETVNKILNSGITIKELMVLPKQIATESYKEDVGTGNIAKAHKGLIYITASAGAIAAGAGMLGIYPQQKMEEYFSHKKIRKEYKKFTNQLQEEFTLAPLEQKDLLIIVPVENAACIINTSTRDDESEVYSDYHQL